MATRSALVNVMVRAADKAARKLKRDFGEVENLQVSRKGPTDFVAAADLRARQILRAELARVRPDYGFVMAEPGASEGRGQDGRRWIVAALDGTANFLHGLPHFAISIAIEENDEILAGAICDPIKNETFIAEKGAGAYLNDRRIRVSSRTRLDESLIATGTPFKETGDGPVILAEIEAVMGASAGLRRWGATSLDLAYVAAGRFDGYWARDPSPWDVAAGIVLVREAGGFVTQIDGATIRADARSVLAGNDALHTPLAKLLRAARATASSV